jgi:Flp pilus assembly protein TadG
MVEFAITAPLLISLLLGLVELGHGLNSYLTVLQSARDSARLGAQIGVADTTPLATIVSNETARLSNGPINASNCSTSGQGYCITSDTSPPDKWVNVRVCYDHDLIVGLPWFADDDIRICSATKMRLAQ